MEQRSRRRPSVPPHPASQWCSFSSFFFLRLLSGLVWKARRLSESHVHPPKLGLKPSTSVNLSLDALRTQMGSTTSSRGCSREHHQNTMENVAQANSSRNTPTSLSTWEATCLGPTRMMPSCLQRSTPGFSRKLCLPATQGTRAHTLWL